MTSLLQQNKENLPEIHSVLQSLTSKIYTILENSFCLTAYKDKENIYNQMSGFAGGWFSLAGIASRHFSTPVIPFLWQIFLQEEQDCLSNS